MDYNENCTCLLFANRKQQNLTLQPPKEAKRPQSSNNRMAQLERRTGGLL